MSFVDNKLSATLRHITNDRSYALYPYAEKCFEEGALWLLAEAQELYIEAQNNNWELEYFIKRLNGLCFGVHRE